MWFSEASASMQLGLFEIMALLSAIIFVGFYGSYGTLCLWYARKRKTPPQPLLDEDSLPTLSLIVPTYNEAPIIPGKFRNLKQLLYPRGKLQIIFVDGGSYDGTPDQIEQLRNGELNVDLVRQRTREGYNKAIEEGFRVARGDIVSITGAETEFEPDALLQLVSYLAARDVGAVTGRQQIKNLSDGVSPGLEAAYRNLYDFMRFAESEMDSAFDIKGEICAAKRDVVAKILANPAIIQKGCIDACFSFQSRLLGLRTVYVDTAVYYENSPSSLRESFAQQVRRGTTLIESFLLFRSLILDRRYGKFGLVIAPAHFSMLLVMPFVLGLLVASLSLVAADRANIWVILLLIAGLAATLISRHLQAFVKAQLCLIASTIGLLTGLDTQRFRKLPSTRITH